MTEHLDLLNELLATAKRAAEFSEQMARGLRNAVAAIEDEMNKTKQQTVSLPELMEMAAMAKQSEVDGWTPELVNFWRCNETTAEGWGAFPEWMREAPSGFTWNAYDTKSGKCYTLLALRPRICL